MKKLLLLVPLCISINAFASHLTNTDGIYYHVCTTSDGGKSWKDGGSVHPSSAISFDATADAIAVGRIGDCNYTGGSWTNHAGDVSVEGWSYASDSVPEAVNGNAAMIFWQKTANTHVESGANYGLDSVCFYDSQVWPSDTNNCWFPG